MKKITIIIAALVILCAGSLTAFFIAKNKQDKLAEESAATSADYALFNFSSDTINKITIELEEQTYVAELTGARWRFVNFDDFDARHVYIQNVCTYMSYLTAQKDYGNADDADLSIYGLDNPTVITASDGKNEYVLYVGNESPNGDYYYVMTSDKNKIYSIDSLTGAVLKSTRDMLKDSYLVPYEPNEVSRIQLIKNDETVYDLTQNITEGGWSMPDKFSNLTVNNTEASTMLTIMVRLEAQEFFEENLQDYSLYGFDNPDATLIVDTTDGNTRTLRFSYNGDKNADNVYVLNEETGQVATYLAYDADFIEDTAENFLVKRLCSLSAHNIEGFDFTLGDVKETFTVDMSNNIIECGNSSVSALGNEGIDAFNNFYNSFSFIEFEKLDIDASPDKSELVMSVNLHGRDENDTLIEFYKADDDYCYAFINGVYTGSLINMDNIDGIRSVTEFYNELKDLIG